MTYLMLTLQRIDLYEFSEHEDKRKYYQSVYPFQSIHFFFLVHTWLHPILPSFAREAPCYLILIRQNCLNLALLLLLLLVLLKLLTQTPSRTQSINTSKSRVRCLRTVLCLRCWCRQGLFDLPYFSFTSWSQLIKEGEAKLALCMNDSYKHLFLQLIEHPVCQEPSE